MPRNTRAIDAGGRGLTLPPSLLVLALALLALGVGLWAGLRQVTPFCEAGTYYFEERQLCVQCLAGSYSLANWTECKPCDAGSFCEVAASSASQNLCPRGAYCPLGSASPTWCPRGRYGAITGLSTANCSGECALAPGMFCEAGSTAPDQLVACPLGFYCDGETPEPLACPAGRLGAELGLFSANCSGECPAGVFCAPGSSTASVPCPAGFHCPAGISAPLPCEPGCWCPVGSETACPNDCPAGTNCPAQSADATTPCPPGSGCPNGIALPCEAGSYCPEGAWSVQQVLCPKGFFCPAGSASPIPCPAGTYGSELEQFNETTACPHPCPSRYYCPPGTSEEAILACPAGHWCPEGTPGEYLFDVNGTLQVQPEEEFRCPGGLRNSRTHLGQLLGCYCNYTGAEAFNAVCECPAAYYCPPGTTYETVRACPFNHYCPEGTATPILCEEPGYYCSRYSSSPRFRAVRAEISLFALTNALAIEQNTSGLEDLSIARARDLGVSQMEALVNLRENNLPVYAAQRGLSELSLDMSSRGISRVRNTLWVCEVSEDDSGGAAVATTQVRLVREFPVANDTADPEVHIGKIVYPIPRDLPTDATYAFCITYVSGSTGLRTALTERFLVNRGLAASRQWNIVGALLWLGLSGWALVVCTRKLWRKNCAKPSRRKYMEFERFRSFHAKSRPRRCEVALAVCLFALDVPLVMLTFIPPPSYPVGVVVGVYGAVVVILASERYAPQRFHLAPFYEHLFGPMLSILLYASTACSYTSDAEFVDQIELHGVQCWWDPRHAFLAAVGLLLAPPFYERAYEFLTDRKPRLSRLAAPVVPAFDVLLLIVRTWSAVAQALGNLSNVDRALAPTLVTVLVGLVVIPVHVKQQPYYGTPWSHRVNDVAAGNLAAQVMAALVAVAANGWSLAHIFFVPCAWACAFTINAKRSVWVTKRLKRRLADTLSPHDEDAAFAYAHEYGLLSGFTHRILQSLGKNGQFAAAVRLEALCAAAAAEDKHASPSSVAPSELMGVYMASAWTHVRVLKLAKLGLDDTAATRLFSALSSLQHVTEVDLRDNALTWASATPFLRDVLPSHAGITLVDLCGNPGMEPFAVSPANVLCPLFARNRLLADLRLHTRLLFRDHGGTVEIHRYDRQRVATPWVYELVSGLLETTALQLRLVLGRGPDVQKEVLRAFLENESARDRVAHVQVAEHAIDFANDEVLTACPHVDDAALLVACAARMPRLRDIVVPEEVTKALGGLDFVQTLAAHLSKGVRSVRVRESVVEVDARGLNVVGRGLWDDDAPIVARLLAMRGCGPELRLEGNRFGDRGIPIIVESALLCGALRRLHIGSWRDGNRLRKDGATALAKLVFRDPAVLRELDVRNNQIGGPGGRALVRTRPLGCLRVLSLSANAVGDVGADACAEMLRENRTLETLRLCRNRITSHGARAIAESLCVNQTLRELFLDWNEIVDEGFLNFAQCMPSFQGLRVLALENNMVGDDGALGISGFGSLQELYLGYNHIADGGVLSLRDALAVLASEKRTSPHLSVLSLTGTRISHMGEKMLRDAGDGVVKIDLENKVIRAGTEREQKLDVD